MNQLIKPLFFLFALFVLSSCEEAFTPKPLGYHRIDFPKKEYLKYQGSCPFEFDYPFRSFLDTNLKGKPSCWLNLHYPQYSSTIHFTYNSITRNELKTYIEDSRKLAMKHLVKANHIEEEFIQNNETNVYGVYYDFGGSTATNFQFFVTDSNNHFLRGAMYFNLPPNPDSLEPVAIFIKEDLKRLLNSFEWKAE
ncbi:MAG: gliding motility lipoprotein GldD [Salibacteraceae bacterium]